jgi:hypothetical protein
MLVGGAAYEEHCPLGLQGHWHLLLRRAGWQVLLLLLLCEKASHCLTAASAIILPSWPPPSTPTTAVRGRPVELQGWATNAGKSRVDATMTVGNEQVMIRSTTAAWAADHKC